MKTMFQVKMFLKNSLLTFLVLFFMGDLTAQSKVIDSLKNQLPKAKSDTTRAMLMNDIGWEYIMTGEYEEALKYSLRGLELSKNNPRQRGATGALNNLGTIYVSLSDYAKALEYFNQSLKLTEKYHNEMGTAGLYNNIGIIHNHLKDFKTAIECHNKSIAIYKKLNHLKGISQCEVNLGTLYYRQKNYAKAIALAESALRFYEQEKNQRDMSLCFSNIGAAYLAMGEFDKAKPFFDRALAIDLQENNKRQITVSYQNLGNIYQKTRKLDQALDYFKKAYALSKTLGSLEQQQSSVQGLYETYKKKGDYLQSTTYLEIFAALRDSIFSSEKNQDINNMKTKFALDRQENVLKNEARVEKEKMQQKAQIEHEQQEAAKKQQRIIIYSVIGILGLTLVFAIFAYNRFTVTRRQNRIIEQQKNEISEQRDVVAEKQKEIIDSINYAKRIQYALLAHDTILKENLPEHFILFQPKDIVSGDFYWATKKFENSKFEDLKRDGSDEIKSSNAQQSNHQISNGSFFLAVCDSTGHGVPGAFMSLLNISFLNEAITEKNITDPARVLDHARQRLIENVSQEGQKDGMDGILIKYGIKDQQPEIVYAAANNAPVIVRNKAIMELPFDKMPIGKGESNVGFQSHVFKPQKGDVLYLYTDGYADQFGGPKGKKFKYSQLNQILCEIAALDVEEQKQTLAHHFEKWKADLEQVDDVCIIGIKL